MSCYFIHHFPKLSKLNFNQLFHYNQISESVKTGKKKKKERFFVALLLRMTKERARDEKSGKESGKICRISTQKFLDFGFQTVYNTAVARTKTSKKKTKTHKDKKVIIVESPTKCKTIRNFLDKNYVLISSQGHIKDLPKSDLGVDINNNFQPRYIRIRGKAKLIKEIKKTCKDSSEIFLAPDPDREGEAIAQHLAEELNSNNTQIKRALFYEITPEHVRKALKTPTTINENLVNAHKARRILDRIVGYYTSPLLWSILKSGLSAGRVQSVALRLICEREQEIESFKSTPYWTAEANFLTGADEKFKGTLWRIDGTYRKIATKEELHRFKGLLKKGVKFNVTSFRLTTPRRFPPPPFITSTLQQEAARRFGFPAKKTMFIAQNLYEGIKLPEGSIGLITYMRTDSIRVNNTALEELRSYISGKFGSEYLNKTVRAFKDSKNVQGGHEAIRPTKIKLEPEKIKEHLTPDQYKLYKLIFDRFTASQMAPARYSKKEAVVSYMGIDFRAEELKPIFLGYQLVSGDVVEKGAVPKMSVGDTVEMLEIEFTEKQTEPSPRYSEASLIKKLEENGIGRPSTYAHILQRLFDRGYVVKENSKIKATELGMQVYNIIIPRFSNIFEVSFTAKMEKKLDQVELGKKAWQEVVQEFYDPFVITLNKTKKEVPKIKESITQKVEKKCPKCQRPLVVRWGKYGKFLACSRYPECKYTRPLEMEVIKDIKCPICGKDMVLREGRTGRFYACIDYPRCPGILPYTTGVKCPECGGELIERKNKRGQVFYACSNYPECKFTLSNKPVPVKCPKCDFNFLVIYKKGRKELFKCIKCNSVFTKEELGNG